MNLDQTTRDDIQRDGLNHPQPLASARSASEQRAKEYQEHCKRLEADEEYRMRWEQRERELTEAKQRNYYY